MSIFDKLISLSKITIVLVVFASVLLYKSYNVTINDNIVKGGVFTQKQLAQYNGITVNKLYLAVVGLIFDVTNGKKHYEEGSSYNYFIGKDGTRALITGDFKDESNEKDHILDLSCNDLSAILHWRQTFKEKYIFVGYLIGRYYKADGKETAYTKQVKSRLKQCKVEKENSEKENLKYPPCNIAWNEDEGSRVWCTRSSGGIQRSWVGVPRQLYTPGEEKPRCVCVNENDLNSNLLKQYDMCPNTSTSCIVQNL